MKNLKLSTTLISFLPILVFVPLLNQIYSNFHYGGLDLFIEFFKSSYTPKLDNEIIYTSIKRINETFFISLISWTISIIFGIIIGILSSDLFYKIFNLPQFFKSLTKLLLTIFRSLHESVWCLILMQIYGINFSTGIIAISIPYTAINAKVISEQLSILDNNKIDSIIQINGNKLSSLITLIWTPIIKIFKTFGIYRFECALRSSSILGLFGIGGIGTNIFLSFKSLSFQELWTYLWSLAILMIITKNLLNRLYFIKLNTKISLFIGIIFISISLFSFLFIFKFLVLQNIDLSYFINNLSQINIDFLSLNSIKLIYETLAMTFLATGIAISLPPFILLIFRDKISIFMIRIICFLLRLIPPPITVLILLIFNEPSISLAALSLGLYNTGITFKLLYENLNSISNCEYIAIKSLSNYKRVSWLYGLFLKQSKSYLAYCSYRTDIIIRETAIVGIIGSIGLGWRLRESFSSFNWSEVTIILIIYSAIAIIGELINDKIRTRLT